MAAILALLSAAPAIAADPTPAATARPAVQIELETLAGNVLTPGGHHQFCIGARSTMTVQLAARLQAFARLDGWRQSDGQPGDVSPKDWSTFDAVELHVGLDVELLEGAVALFGAVGQGAPLVGAAAIAEPHPVTAVAGLRLGSSSGPRLLRIGAGRYSAIGSALAGIGSGRVRLAGRSSFILEGAVALSKPPAAGTPTPRWIVRTAIAIGTL